MSGSNKKALMAFLCVDINVDSVREMEDEIEVEE